MPYCKNPNTGEVTFEVGSCPVGTVVSSAAEKKEYQKQIDIQDAQEGAFKSWEKMPLYRNDPGQAYYGSTSTGETGKGYMAATTAAEFINIPQQLWATDPDQFKSVAKTLKNIPGFDNDGSIESVDSQFGGFLEMLSRSGLQMDPFDALNYFEQLAKAQGYKPGGGGGGGATTRSIVNLTNEFDAEALVNGALNSYLGRDATEDEVQEFWKKLNKAEKANPVISGPNGSKGGYNPQLAAEKFAEQDEEYADTQVEVTYKQLIGNAIRGRLNETVEGML